MGTTAEMGKKIGMIEISRVPPPTPITAVKIDVKKQLGNVAASHSRLLYIQRTLEFIDLGSQPLISLDFEQTYWQNFLSKMQLFEGVKDLLDEIRQINLGGGNGSIIGRNTFQRPKDEAISLLKKIIAIYKNE